MNITWLSYLLYFTLIQIIFLCFYVIHFYYLNQSHLKNRKEVEKDKDESIKEVF